jgi:hypothetical protein
MTVHSSFGIVSCSDEGGLAASPKESKKCGPCIRYQSDKRLSRPLGRPGRAGPHPSITSLAALPEGASGGQQHPPGHRKTDPRRGSSHQRPDSSAALRDSNRATGQQLHDAKPSCVSKDSALCGQRRRGQHSPTPTAGPRAAHSRQPRSLRTPRGSQHSQQNQSEPAFRK